MLLVGGANMYARNREGLLPQQLASTERIRTLFHKLHEYHEMHGLVGEDGTNLMQGARGRGEQQRWGEGWAEWHRTAPLGIAVQSRSVGVGSRGNGGRDGP